MEHRDTKVLPNSSLVVEKGGPKLNPPVESKKPDPWAIGAADDGSPAIAPSGLLGRPVTVSGKNMATFMMTGRAVIMASSQSLSALAQVLGNYAGRPVVDATGLTGQYDFSLEFESTGYLARR